VANPYENLEAIYHMAEVSWVRAYQQRFQSVRFVRYGAQELAAASDSLLFGAMGDTGRIARFLKRASGGELEEGEEKRRSAA
jgi:hypothetical protein